MTVKELIDELKRYDDNRPVYIFTQTDGEYYDCECEVQKVRILNGNRLFILD